ncbi:MAG TPA: SPOR domain-containing protein [Burkholderiales bacterium]|jgi:DedD protein|nr:SPOR domain-containing protein [Burkholderiales bacterium]
MARTISDEERQLKRRARRRLIGAIVLVTAMVVVLPMVLDPEPRPTGEEVSVRIPSPDASAFSPKLAPEPPAPKAAPPTRAAEAKPEPKAPPAAPAPTPAPEKTAKAAPAKPAAPPSPKPDSGQYVIQVIALADADKANELRDKITAAGINSYTEVVKTVKGDVTRVRAGPFADRKSAEKAQQQLKAIGLSGNITTK